MSSSCNSESGCEQDPFFVSVDESSEVMRGCSNSERRFQTSKFLRFRLQWRCIPRYLRPRPLLRNRVWPW